MRHYIVMAGLHDCLPNVCEVFAQRAAAVAYATELRQPLPAGLGFGELRPDDSRGSLSREGYVELSLYSHGNEYVEIVACDCATPEVHSDAGGDL